MATADLPTTGNPCLSGSDIISRAALNKGTAFTEEERDALGLRGLVPPRVFSQDEQVQRVMANYRRKATDLERYIFLIALQNRNERLFYRVVADHIEEMMPIIYTPVVGQACVEFAGIYRRPQGMFLSLRDRGRMVEILRNWPRKDVGVICVTDGERILGLGDLGANGMGIPIGKLSLYTACAGVDPTRCLPIALDTGTNNEALRSDPMYIGLNQERLRGPEYDSFVEEFVAAVEEVFPNALIQFEDFGNTNAFRLLRRYRNRVCTFNDDIQGTASVTVAGLISAARITGVPLEEQRVLLLGAGEAAAGIASLIVAAKVASGMSEGTARKDIWMVDSKGLVTLGRDRLQEHKLPFAHDIAYQADLVSAIDAMKPTSLIGVSGQPQTFTQAVVERMCVHNERPFIGALSNPTSKAECTAEQTYTWSQGRAVFTSGSPFNPVEWEGQRFVPGQGNNAYVFPGVGLGVVACQATRVTDSMFMAAARSLAAHATEEDVAQGCVFPSLTRIHEVSLAIAVAVAEVVYAEGLTTMPRPDDLASFIQEQMYDPAYVSLLDE